MLVALCAPVYSASKDNPAIQPQIQPLPESPSRRLPPLAGEVLGSCTRQGSVRDWYLQAMIPSERVRDKIAASKRKGLWVGGPVPLGYAALDKKVEVVPAEAAAVRTIFARYLELGSVRALADDLGRRGIRSKARQLANGRTIGGGAFGVGALAYLLKNRFYLGEVVYRGEVHPGPHEAILDPALFTAVQERLADQAIQRRCRLRGSAALLTGHLFGHKWMAWT
jgi:hypothetical protein